MFNRKLYKKEGWLQSKGLVRKMLSPLLVMVIAGIVIYGVMYISAAKTFYKIFVEHDTTPVPQSGLTQIGQYLFNSVLVLILNFFGFIWTRYVWNFRKTGEYSFQSFKACFSLKGFRAALWFCFRVFLWLLPTYVCLFAISRISVSRVSSPSPTGEFDPRLFITVFLLYASTFYMIFAYIKIMGYTLMPYVLAENPKIPVIKALSLSVKMCKGCRENIFVMYLSYTLWYIFCIVTLGFGRILLFPYIENSFINMYESVKKNAIESKVVSEEEFYVLQ